MMFYGGGDHEIDDGVGRRRFDNSKVASGCGMARKTIDVWNGECRWLDEE